MVDTAVADTVVEIGAVVPMLTEVMLSGAEVVVEDSAMVPGASPPNGGSTMPGSREPGPKLDPMPGPIGSGDEMSSTGITMIIGVCFASSEPAPIIFSSEPLPEANDVVSSNTTVVEGDLVGVSSLIPPAAGVVGIGD